jgi:hypothetical protein
MTPKPQAGKAQRTLTPVLVERLLTQARAVAMLRTALDVNPTVSASTKTLDAQRRRIDAHAGPHKSFDQPRSWQDYSSRSPGGHLRIHHRR